MMKDFSLFSFVLGLAAGAGAASWYIKNKGGTATSGIVPATRTAGIPIISSVLETPPNRAFGALPPAVPLFPQSIRRAA